MKKIGVGFVGAGWMGKVLLQRLAERDDCELLALLNRRPERARAVLVELGLDENLVADDYQSILANPAIDTVWLCDPNGLHGPEAIAAMQAGKHVFCEKPPATAFADFCRQIELERANPELITFIDYILYFDTMQKRLRGMVADGEFGQITQIQVNYRHPVNTEGDKAWKLSKELMGDAFGMGINHSITVMLSIMSPQAKPVSLYATSQRAKVRPFEAEAIWSVMITFDNGATGICLGNIDSGNGYDAYHSLYGTTGGFVFESQVDRPNKVRYWSDRSTGGDWVYPLDAERCAAGGAAELAWPVDTTTPDTGNVILHQSGACVDHFIDCVKTGVKSPLSFANSLAISEIGWAAQMSARLGQSISLPLDWDEAARFFASQ